jgi:hypothetical protein
MDRDCQDKKNKDSFSPQCFESLSCPSRFESALSFLWRDGAPDGAGDAFASVLAECAHALAEFFPGAHGTASRHVLAEAFAAATRAATCARKRALDAAPFAAAEFPAHTASSSSVAVHSHYAAALTVLCPQERCGEGACAEALAQLRQYEERR